MSPFVARRSRASSVLRREWRCVGATKWSLDGLRAALSQALPWPPVLCSSASSKAGFERQRGKQDQAGIAVGLEHRETDYGIIDVEPCNLPSEMGGECEQSERKYRA